MAGDWIKMRVDLSDDPAVIGIALATGIDEDCVVGKLHRLWAWADAHTVDGNAASVTGALAKKWIDRYLRTDGFAEAMIGVGWLVIDEDGVHFPRFERHNGKTGKQRALTAKRVARTRGKGNAKGNAVSVTNSVTEAHPSALPREEKRREELNTPTECLGETEKSERAKRFIPPTVEEVAAYCQERGNGIDAQRFVDFYAARGWMAGKTKMRDWQAAVRTWERNEGGGGIRGKPALHSGLMELAAEREQELDQ